MFKKILTHIGYGVLWVLIIVVVVYAERLTAQNNREKVVSQTNIEIEGGISNPMIDAAAISNWLKEHNTHPEGTVLEKLDIATIESVVESHNAVAEANVCASYDGEVDIDIVQREPIARIRIAGYDHYLSDDGYLLSARGVAPVHVPVITGDYKPLFKRGFIGYAKDVTRDTIAAMNDSIQRLEDAKIPYFKQLIDNNRTLRVVKRSSPKKNPFDSDEEYEILVGAYKERLSHAVEAHSQNARNIKASIAALEDMQEALRQRIKNITEQDKEFEALRKFILHIEQDPFWRAEIVQIVATGGGESPLQIAIIPRSGRFTVDLGTMERLNKKLSTLRRFYAKGLSNVGWDKYRSISLRYDGQVVCR